MQRSSARARLNANSSPSCRHDHSSSPAAVRFSHATCGASSLAYLLNRNRRRSPALRKEVIHVSLSPCRGVSEGVDHLERRLDWGTRLTSSSLGHDNGGRCGKPWRPFVLALGSFLRVLGPRGGAPLRRLRTSGFLRRDWTFRDVVRFTLALGRSKFFELRLAHRIDHLARRAF